MTSPVVLETFAGASGSGEGYRRAGYEVYAIELHAKPLQVNPFPYLQADAMQAMADLLDGKALTFSDGRELRLEDIDLIHGSPPCQGYSIMNNLPWIRSRTYPLLILPFRELCEATGKPYVIENVAGAASKANLEKLGLLEHRLRAFWLCGGMFGLPIYRHRYFETNFFWPMPGHPKHVNTRQPESSFSPRPRGVWEKAYEAENPGRSEQAAKAGLNLTPGYEHVPFSAMGWAKWEEHAKGNGAQATGVADGHAAGWRVAAEAMGITWMRRAELTQAVPPCFTEYIGGWALKAVHS